MSYEAKTPFDNIESAQRYLKLLEQTVVETTQSVQRDLVLRGNAESSRGVDALRLVSYKMEKLEHHLKVSCRILNDLRMLRRLLLQQEQEMAESSASTF